MGDTDELSDRSLVRAAGSGDMDALGELYLRHQEMVYELCLRMVGAPDLAEDLTQEAFLRVGRYGSTFDGRSSVRSWLYRLVRNQCLDALAARRREGDKRKAWEAEMKTQQGGPEADPHRVALIRQALDRLKPHYREVLVLSRFAGMKYREIAEVCDLSVSNVKVRAHRAMIALHAAVRELEHGNEV